MCRICQYNQVKTIDRALLSGVSLTSLTQQYDFSLPELQRHHQHLQHKMAQARQRFHDLLHQGLFCKLNLVMEMVFDIVRGAKAGQDFKLFLQASREFTRITSLMHKMAVPLDQELLYCLMSSPQWDLQDSLLPAAFQALSDTRQTLKVNLFASCPDPEPEPAVTAPEPSPLLGTRSPDLTAPDPDTAPDRGVDPGPRSPSCPGRRKPAMGYRQPSAPAAPHERDTSAK